MKSAKNILTRGLCHSASVGTMATSRPGVSVSAEHARKIFEKLEDERPLRSTETADLIQNRHLNRWNNVLPFDATRVKLSDATCENSPNFNDYINASRVDAPGVDDMSYILTQGPLPATVGHFWTMVWQQHVSAIIMLCKLTESGICKCAPYWPETDEEDDLIHMSDVGLEVRLRDFMDEGKDFSVRNLELRHCETDSIRVISQFHYMTWPDFGVPASTSTFLKFLRAVNSKHHSSRESPNVVHCSAGIGRSGTFILADVCLSRMRQTKKRMSRVQIIDTLVEMRQMRGGLIQSWEQLRFCLQAIEDGMASIEFSDQCDVTLENGLQQQQQPNSTDSGVRTRKRSTESPEELSDHEQSQHANNSSSSMATTEPTAAAPPKRPKANC